jgi:hypothetical protein
MMSGWLPQDPWPDPVRLWLTACAVALFVIVAVVAGLAIASM